ncbi:MULTISPECIES: NAD(P)-binding domain-containing protein [Thermodesulfobacterium]|jgi:thioredoxin reductase (NADPH)|uniref:NAD(P)-binding domain-containing protein n=1 Tax=Thermodesulfobacterium TaxID=1740 RepID=UPI000ED8C783|nr:NAD(P)-binding domain-containing protein [Thermodesulfobacterium sp.]MBZ4682431.1 oxidoreductase [Thermodesulfobacterium sp.]HCE80531.1 oxidoreductase [Thermodesulfobacterium commune]
MEKPLERVKIAIVGGGPAGIACAIEAKAKGLEPVVVLEKHKEVCYTISKFYKPGKRVDADYRDKNVKPIGLCSFETETKEEFLERINSWIKQWNLDVRLNSEVTNVVKNNGSYEIWVKDEPKFLAEFVIIAIGIFCAPNKPEYPIPSELKNRVFFEPPDVALENKKILVVGGGNTAAEVSLQFCEKNEVHLSYRRPSFFRINETNLNLLYQKEKEGKIKLLLGTDIIQIAPEGEKIKVFFKDGMTGFYDVIIYCLGGTTPKNFLKKIGIEFDEKGNPILNEHLETNLPKIFLAGDLAVKGGNILKAFNSAHTIIEKITEYEKNRA